ncbi:uncharacterized protein [Typha latifolia]|uniref:uncharacterized protein n=1 Tax=Typha latifolia TaxID=4733 RepID=UPI003C2B3747
MADRGGPRPSSSSTAPPVTASQFALPSSPSSSSLDGGFLLKLLQKPSSLPSHYQNHQLHHDDPAVAAMGPSHSFSPNDFPRTLFPQQTQFPESSPHVSPLFSAPLNPLLWPPFGSSDPRGPGNHHFFPLDHQRLGLSPGGADPLAVSPPRCDLYRSPGCNLGNQGVRDQISLGKKDFGARVRDERSSLRPPPGFGKLQPGSTQEFDRGSGRGSVPAQRSQAAVEHGRPPGAGSRPRGSGQWVATSERQEGSMKMGSREESQRRENLQSHSYQVHTMPNRDAGYLHRSDLKSPPIGSRLPVGNSHYPSAQEKCTEESEGLDYIVEGNISRAQRLVKSYKSEIGVVASSMDNCGEEEGLSDRIADVLSHGVDDEVKNAVTRVSSSRGKDLSRGHHVSSQRMRIQTRTRQCRRDIDAWTTSFLSIFESLVPAEEEISKQKQLLQSLGKLISKDLPNAQLFLYGSCASSFGVSNSDIDVCLAIDDTQISKPDILLKLADILQYGNFQNVQALTRARVPIVKLMDPVTGLSCDICINNLLAVANTKLLRDYAKIDRRLRQLAFIVKHWAKSRRVNETYQGTLSSYAYVIMCIHFLQLRRPAILPCLQAMKATYVAKVDNMECAYFDQVDELRNFGAQNKESIGRLLWAFFHYWAYCHDYTNDVISIRTGSIISKLAKDWTRRIGNDRHLICIEDPFEISHDLGRVVDKYSIKILREEFERAADILQFDPNPSVTLFEPYMPLPCAHNQIQYDMAHINEN